MLRGHITLFRRFAAILRSFAGLHNNEAYTFSSTTSLLRCFVNRVSGEESFIRGVVNRFRGKESHAQVLILDFRLLTFRLS
jgi:hypothetical protein